MDLRQPGRRLPAGHPGRVALVLLFISSHLLAATVQYTENSDPPGFFETSTTKETPCSVTTRVASMEISGYRLTHWTLWEGAGTNRLNDNAGRALNPFTFTILNPSTATAHYRPATDDANTNGVPDWFEILFYDSVTNAAASDTDSDGFDLAAEYVRDWHPNLGNAVTDGGVSCRRSLPQTIIADSNYVHYTVRTIPAGLYAYDEIVTNGSVMKLPDLYGLQTAYRFGQWFVNGTRIADNLGRSVGNVIITITGETAAVAYCYPTSEDMDSDGIPDWYEWQIYGALGNDPASDTDGDGFSLAAEYLLDYHPGITNTIVEGGVSCRRSEGATIYGPPYAPYVINSSPAGLVYSYGYVTSGTQVATMSLHGDTGGYVFSHWTVNGARQEDLLGFALSKVVFTVTTGTTATAHYVPGADDTDLDGVPDWFEWHAYGGLGNSGDSDTDGDGFALSTEFSRDWCPQIHNTVVEGGVSERKSIGATVDLQLFERVVYANVNGAFANFFTPWPTNVTGEDFRGNTAPALGDWDGDGDLDLFVGASGGVMRVYANHGSPTVFNLYDRTTNFSALAGAWTNVPDPAPALGDWNGDGKADLAIGGETNAIRLVSFSGGSQLPAVVTDDLVLSISIPAGVPTNIIPAFAAHSVSGTNGTAWADLLVLLGDGTVNLYTNTGSASTPYDALGVKSNLLGEAAAGATGLSVADVNGDGLNDVLVSDNVGRIWEYRQHGDGTFILASRVFAGTYPGFANRLTIAAADVDGDGDMDVIGGFAEGGLIYLRNGRLNLMISPPVASLMPGESRTFTAQNARGAVTWSFLQNNSSGTLSTAGGVYTAGIQSACIDLIQGIDSRGMTGRAYVNVFSPAVTSLVGRAVILAGRKAESDPLWPATDYLADHAYNTLRYRGYSKEHLQYLSPVTNQDVDVNSMADDVDLLTTWTNAATTFTNWVNGPGSLFVYLVDHGSAASGHGYFRLNSGEVLAATNLDAWLDQLQDAYNTEVTVVLDFCYAGSFAAELGYAGSARRTVVAACGTNEPTYFVAGGLVSFSDVFFSGALMGMDVLECFTLGRDTMSGYQTAILSGPAAGVSIGVEDVVGRDIPQIGSVTPNLTLHGDESVVLWAAGISSAYTIERVWCLVVPPGHQPDPANPVIDIPEIELTLNGSRYEAAVSGFGEEGLYKVLYCARDIWGGVSLPKSSYVTQTNIDERVILVAGGPTNALNWLAINNMANLAYHTLRERWIEDERICYLNASTNQDLDGDGASEVDGLPLLSNLANAITNWAGTTNSGGPADKLTVILAGDEQSGLFLMDAGERLSSTNLDAWLDLFQSSNAATVNVILDFGGAAGWLGSLTAPTGEERIVMASTHAGGSACRAVDGMVSFMQSFMSQIFSGRSVGEAFEMSRAFMTTVTGRKQKPALDDNGDGVYNAKVDGKVAALRYIGTAFMTGADTPAIGEVQPGMVGFAPENLLLWIANVTDMDGLSNVWCVITPPDYDGTGGLQRIDLAWNPVGERYEVLCTNFMQAGLYVCTFYARDNSGEISSPSISLVGWVGDLSIADCVIGGSDPGLSWPVGPGLMYEVLAKTNLLSGSWYAVSGPIEATNGQARMKWAETNALDKAGFYRIKARMP